MPKKEKRKTGQGRVCGWLLHVPNTSFSIVFGFGFDILLFAGSCGVEWRDLVYVYVYVYVAKAVKITRSDLLL
jgi:hypothetical protein